METARLNIPINLRGQRIGNLVLQRKSGNDWGQADRSLAAEVANQVGLALENARLLEDTQERASQGKDPGGNLLKGQRISKPA